MYASLHPTSQISPDDLSVDVITNVNNVVTSLLAGAVTYLDVKPKEDSGLLAHSQTTADPASEKALIQMLLLNIFNGCGMTYKACQIEELSILNGMESSIAGQPSTRYATGSFYEGIGCASPTEVSDLDTMHVLKNFKLILPYKNESGDKQETEISTDIGTDEDTSKNNEDLENTSKSVTRESPGTRVSGELKTIGQNNLSQVTPDRNSTADTDASIRILSAKISKFPGYISLVADSTEAEIREITQTLNHGPVIRRDEMGFMPGQKFEFDDAIAVECNTWPAEAKRWKSRSRASGWPEIEIIKQCQNTPCYVVRKPHATNLDDQHEWRFSFAMQEAILLRSLTVMTKMIYILTKIILKTSVLQEVSLTTYHLKTLFLWFLERNPVDNFTKCGIDDNVKNFLSFVLKHVNEQNIPNYFISENNMIAHFPKNGVNKMKDQIEHILANFTSALVSVKTTYRYPFSTSSIGEHITDDQSMRYRCLAMLRSNFLSIIVEQVINASTFDGQVVWMYCNYFEALILNLDRTEQTVTIVEKTLTATQKKCTLIYSMFGKPFIKLGMMYCSYTAQVIPEAYSKSTQLYTSLVKLPKDSDNSTDSMAKVTCIASLQHGVNATETCCTLWKQAGQSGVSGELFRKTLGEMLQLMEGTCMKDDSYCLTGCLVAMINTLQLSTVEIDLGVAINLPSIMSSELKQLLISTIKISTDNMMKQLLVFWVVQSIAGLKRMPIITQFDNADIPGMFSFMERKAKKTINEALRLCTINIQGTFLDTFIFVVAVIVFQKLTEDTINIKLVRKMLDDIKISRPPDSPLEVEKLEKDIVNLIQSDSIDTSEAFDFIVSYTQKAIMSIGFDFVLSSLNDLKITQLFTLRILDGVGKALLKSGAVAESIAATEAWLANVSRSPISKKRPLVLKMYGFLGHLYHVDSLTTCEGSETGSIHSPQTRCVSKYRHMNTQVNTTESRAIKSKMARVMFRTALKDFEHPSVIIDFLLLIWQENSTEFTKYLDNVLKMNVFWVSSFNPHSAAVLSHMTELHEEVVSRKLTNISSVVFAHYMAIRKDKDTVDKAHAAHGSLGQHLLDMATATVSLEKTYVEKGEKMDSGEHEVLVGSLSVLGLAAYELDMPDVALKTFKRVLSLDSTSKLAARKVKELSKSEDEVVIIYSRHWTTRS